MVRERWPPGDSRPVGWEEPLGDLKMSDTSTPDGPRAVNKQPSLPQISADHFIGQGAYGRVYLATYSGKEVAVKVREKIE